jgi:hypothetical protein
MNFFPVDRDPRNFGVEKWPEVLRNVDGLAGFSVCKDESAFGPALVGNGRDIVYHHVHAALETRSSR